MKVDAGEYEYPFNFRLPRNLPSSTELDYGCIRYKLHFFIDDLNKQIVNIHHEITVIKHYDLNDEPALKVRTNFKGRIH